MDHTGKHKSSAKEAEEEKFTLKGFLSGLFNRASSFTIGAAAAFTGTITAANIFMHKLSRTMELADQGSNIRAFFSMSAVTTYPLLYGLGSAAAAGLATYALTTRYNLEPRFDRNLAVGALTGLVAAVSLTYMIHKTDSDDIIQNPANTSAVQNVSCDESEDKHIAYAPTQSLASKAKLG